MHTLTLSLNPRELSHEMRISLTGILSTAELLDHDDNLNSEQHEQLSLIQQAGFRLLAVVNQILNAVANSEEKKNKLSISNKEKEQIKNHIHVLLVEDEPIVQKIHTNMLQKLGCKVDLAVNAEEALAKANNDYDIIFMDVGLPGDKSGIEVTHEIRSRELGKKEVPIIVLTGYADVEIKERCLNAKANAVYTKPIGMGGLNKVLQEYVLTT